MLLLPYRTALWGIGLGYLNPGFPWWDGLSDAGEFTQVVWLGAGM
jgi:hypothetical protein